MSNYFYSIRDKKLSELTIKELAYIHLTAPSWGYRIRDGVIKSSLSYLLSEINHAKVQFYSQNLVPIISVFAVLEQLGFCYKRNDIKEYSNKHASAVKKSLYYFAGLEDDSEDVNALYALRNSLLHNGSLLSKSNKKSNNYFFLYNRNINVLLNHSLVNWNGSFVEFDSETMTTTINPDKLILTAHEAVDKAISLLNSGHVDVILHDQEIEMYYRFLKMTPKVAE